MGCEVIGPMLGVLPDDKECEVIARGGNVCAGYCYPFALFANSVIAGDTDPSTGAAYVVSTVPGGPGSTYGNIRGASGVASVDQNKARMVIAMEDIADEQRGRVKLQGLVKAIVGNVSDSITKGQPVTIKTATISYLDADLADNGANNSRFIGFTMEAVASGASIPAAMTVYFDGFHGFGAGGR